MTLESGGAVLAEADQNGVPLTIDVYGPGDNKLVVIDSENGPNSPEPIRITAFETGTYRFVIHSAIKSAAPGSYVIVVSDVLSGQSEK